MLARNETCDILVKIHHSVKLTLLILALTNDKCSIIKYSLLPFTLIGSVGYTKPPNTHFPQDSNKTQATNNNKDS